MGTLIGHVGPGFAFFVMGFWHLFNHVKLLALKGKNYKSLPWFPTNFYNFRHLELYLFMMICFASFSVELFFGLDRHQLLDTDGTIPSKHLHNFEHSCISITFFIQTFFALVLDKWSNSNMLAQYDVLQFMGGLAYAQQLLLFHLHSSDHMGVEGQYHWLLQLVIFTAMSTTILGIAYPGSFIIAFARSLSILFFGLWLMVMGFALWTPNLIPKGCFLHVEQVDKMVRCDGDDSLHRAKALVNILFSWILILLAIFAASFYVFIMNIYGDKVVEYNPMYGFDQEEDVEAHKIGKKFNEMQSFVTRTDGFVNNKPIDFSIICTPNA